MAITMDEIRAREVVELPQMTPLQQALLQARVKILDADDVRAYQAEKVRQGKAEQEPNGGMPRFRFWWESAGAELPEHLRWNPYFAARCAGGKIYYGTGVPTYAATRVGVFPLPPEAVTLMEQVAATGVEAVFMVEQFDIDPFLWVYQATDICTWDNVEKYPLCVWDEKGFHPR